MELKPTLMVAVDANALERLFERIDQLETALSERIGAVSSRLDGLESKIIIPEYEPEYVLRAEAFKFFPFKATKLRELTKARFKNGEAVIRTRRLNAGAKGVTYCVADLKEADLRAEMWRREEQSLPMRNE